MKTWKLKICLMICLQALVLLGGLLAAANTSDNKPKQKTGQPAGPLIHSLEGRDLYLAYCASCHGAEAKGNGPMAPALVAKTADLTTIAQRNGGIYPKDRVQRIITGNETLLGHGSREMPVWGPVFHQIQEDHDYGNVRLRNLTEYLQTLQK